MWVIGSSGILASDISQINLLFTCVILCIETGDQVVSQQKAQLYHTNNWRKHYLNSMYSSICNLCTSYMFIMGLQHLLLFQAESSFQSPPHCGRGETILSTLRWWWETIQIYQILQLKLRILATGNIVPPPSRSPLLLPLPFLLLFHLLQSCIIIEESVTF